MILHKHRECLQKCRMEWCSAYSCMCGSKKLLNLMWDVPWSLEECVQHKVDRGCPA